MKNKKVTLYVIIVLLIIFVPLAVFSTTMHFKNVQPKEENPNHDFYYEGKLYFYKDGNLLGTYTCEHTDGYCDYAVTRLNKEYSLEEYQEVKAQKMGILENRYVFLMDVETENLATAEYILYDLENNRIMQKYSEVKNYGIGIEKDNFIVKNNNGKWGVFQFFDGISLKIPFQYDYIGLVGKKDMDSGKIIADTFAVLNNGKWQLIDINGAEFTGLFEQEIFSYNGEYIILNENGAMKIVDYTGKPVLPDSYSYLNFYSKYLAVIDHTSQAYLYDLATNTKVSNTHTVTNTDTTLFEIEDNKISIKIDGTVVESIAIK